MFFFSLQSPSHASTAAPMAASYYPYPAPTFAPPPFQLQPPSHMQPAINPQNMVGMIQPPPQCNGQPPQGNYMLSLLLGKIQGVSNVASFNHCIRFKTKGVTFVLWYKN